MSAALETIFQILTISIDAPAVGAGLALVQAGGDFADGVIAFDGRRLGGETFITFDRDASKLLAKAGFDAALLSSGPCMVKR